MPLYFYGMSVTASAAWPRNFYSNSIDPVNRQVLSRNMTRGYGEFEVDVRPPALFKDFHRGGGAFFFRHLIEPYITYRRIVGVNNFDRIIRFDYIDAIANTNEIEFGITNRFFTRRSTENVSSAAAKATQDWRKDSHFDAALRSVDDHGARQIFLRSLFWRRVDTGPQKSVLSHQHAFGF